MSIRGKVYIKILLLALLSTFTISANGVKIRVGSTEVVEGSSLSVKLVADGKDIEFPDIQDVGGFPVEDKFTGTKLESSYINGTFSSKNIKTLQFNFYPEVDVTIPSYSVKIAGKVHKTQPVKIRVIKATEVSSKSVDGYSMNMRTNKSTVYVGEPFIVTIDFFEPQNSRVAKVEYTPPKFKNFFSKALGGERLKRTSKGAIHELQYLLSAKKEGKFTILAPKARVGIRSLDGTGMDPWGIFANDVRWHSVLAKSLRVNVSPLPIQTEIIGKFRIESHIDKSKVKKNSPVAYTVKISGNGTLEDFEDPKFDIEGVTVYSDEPKYKSTIRGNIVESSYEKRYVFISDKDFTIPALNLSGFDYGTKKTYKLSTKAQDIVIDTSAKQVISKKSKNTNTKDDAESTEQTVSRAKASKTVMDKNQSILEDREYYDKLNQDKFVYKWWHMLLSFMAGMFAIIGIQRVFKIVKQKDPSTISYTKKYSMDEALKFLYPHINEDKKIESMVRKLYKIQNGDKSVSIDSDYLAKMIWKIRTR